MKRAVNQQRNSGDIREGHGVKNWTKSSRTLQVKSVTSVQRNSCLFFQFLLLFFRVSRLILLASWVLCHCQTSGPIKEERKEVGENV